MLLGLFQYLLLYFYDPLALFSFFFFFLLCFKIVSVLFPVRKCIIFRAFAKSRTAPSLHRSLCLSLRVRQLGSLWKDLHQTWRSVTEAHIWLMWEKYRAIYVKTWGRVDIVDSSMKYFVPREYAKGTNFCLQMAIRNNFILLTATSVVQKYKWKSLLRLYGNSG
jgi:hypothetical protein